MSAATKEITYPATPLGIAARKLAEAEATRQTALKETREAEEEVRRADRNLRSTTRDVWKAIRRLRGELDVPIATLAHAIGKKAEKIVELEDSGQPSGFDEEKIRNAAMTYLMKKAASEQ